MGDGGLAAGAALLVAGVPAKRKLDNAYFGPSETRQSVLDAVKSRRNLKATEAKNPENLAADTIEDEQTYAFWFQGGMEFGPRALGNRSIIAPAASLDVKNELNLKIKSRNWYQPFCPSILEGEARKLFSDYDGVPDKFMTMGYACREGALKRMAAAIHVDGSARPQMVGKEAPRYGRLISRVKRRTGTGVVLNTSFNLHGDPIVCSINDALDMMERTRSPHLFAEGIHITIKERR
jgi:carbamoyltransferase